MLCTIVSRCEVDMTLKHSLVCPFRYNQLPFCKVMNMPIKEFQEFLIRHELSTPLSPTFSYSIRVYCSFSNFLPASVWKTLVLRALVFSERKTMGWGVCCGRIKEWWQEGQEGIEKTRKVKRSQKELRLKLQDISPKETARVGRPMDIRENIIFNAFKDQLKAHKTNLKT